MYEITFESAFLNLMKDTVRRSLLTEYVLNLILLNKNKDLI